VSSVDSAMVSTSNSLFLNYSFAISHSPDK
jgi:hypothetical protein